MTIRSRGKSHGWVIVDAREKPEPFTFAILRADAVDRGGQILVGADDYHRGVHWQMMQSMGYRVVKANVHPELQS